MKIKVFLICIGLLVLIAAARAVPSLYYEVTREKYDVEISANIGDIDFGLLAAEFASAVKVREGKLYGFKPYRLNVDTEGNIKDFHGSFIAIRNDKPVHFQVRLISENRLQASRSWDVNLSKEEVSNYADFSRSLSLINRIPWAHLSDNITTVDYDYLGISNMHTGDGEGNLRVYGGRGTTKSYRVNENGEITQIIEDMLLPAWEYQAITVYPITYTDESKTSAKGSLEVEYFFKVR